MTPYVQKEVGAPATPEYFYLTSTPNYDNTSNEIKLAFYVKNADVNGNVLDPEKMYYNVYVNGSTEPFKFKKGTNYNYMEQEELVNIPFNYKDKNNYDFKVVDNLRIRRNRHAAHAHGVASHGADLSLVPFNRLSGAGSVSWRVRGDVRIWNEKSACSYQKKQPCTQDQNFYKYHKAYLKIP